MTNKDSSLLYLLVLMAICGLSLVHAAPSKPFEKEESDRISSIINHEISSGKAASSVKAAFFAVASQKLTNNNPAPADSSKYCSLIAAELNSASSLEKIYYAAQLNELLDCSQLQASLSLNNLLSDTFSDDTSSAKDLIFAANTALSLGEKKVIELNKAELTQIIPTIENSFGRKGLVTFEKKDSFFLTGLSFSTLSRIAQTIKLAESDRETLSILTENAETVLGFSLSSPDSDGSAFFDDGDSRTAFRVSYSLLQGVYSLREATNSDFFFNPAVISSVAEFFLANVERISNTEDAYYFLQALHFFSNNKVTKPLALALLTETVSLGSKSADNLVKISVTDLFGIPISEGSVFLIKASKLFAPEKVVLSNQELTKDSTSAGIFSFNFLSQKPEPTFYVLDFGVKTSTGTIKSTSRVLKVSTTVSVSSIDLNISDDDIRNGKKHS